MKVQRVLYAISSMRPTEQRRQPEIVRQLQEAGFTTLLLTSRGYGIRDSTRRELRANGYDFRQSSLAPREGFAGPYFPYDVSRIEQSGITRAEAEQWLADSRNSGQIEEPREITYNEGICMVAGQNKGVMLRMLLHKSGHVDKFDHIVFVDDNRENTKDVREAFANQPVNMVTFRYTREDANVRRFNESRCCEKYCATLALMRIKKSWETTDVSRTNPPHTASPARVPAWPQPAYSSDANRADNGSR